MRMIRSSLILTVIEKNDGLSHSDCHELLVSDFDPYGII